MFVLIETPPLEFDATSIDDYQILLISRELNSGLPTPIKA